MFSRTHGLKLGVKIGFVFMYAVVLSKIGFACSKPVFWQFPRAPLDFIKIYVFDFLLCLKAKLPEI